MSAARWLPLGQLWNEFDTAHNEMNRWLQHVALRDPAEPPGVPVAYPPINVWDDADNVYLEADLPGTTLENLEITIADGNRLTLQGQRKPAAVDKTTWHRRERSFGSF